MTDLELLDAIDGAMRIVAEQFRAKNEAERIARGKATDQPRDAPPTSHNFCYPMTKADLIGGICRATIKVGQPDNQDETVVTPLVS
jgi:hypothetical protein